MSTESKSADLLLAAARSGDAAELSRLLKAHPDLLYTAGGQWDQPLLHHAAKNGHLDCVNVLLAAGYDVNHRDKLDNATALHFTLEKGRLPILRRLIEAGADVQGDGDVHELTAIGWATGFKELHREAAELLLEHGARLNIWAAIALERLDEIRRIVAADRRQLHIRGSRWENLRTPLHFAASRNLVEVVELLIELGADGTARDSRGETPIDYAPPDADPAVIANLEAAGGKRATARENRFQSVNPILNVKSVTASIEYYVDKLGFRKLWDWGTPPTFGAVGRDSVELFLCQDAQGNAGAWMSIWVKDVDALYADYQRTGAIIKQRPTNFPWGTREMNVEDLDGHRLRMSGASTGKSDGVPLKED